MAPAHRPRPRCRSNRSKASFKPRPGIMSAGVQTQMFDLSTFWQTAVAARCLKMHRRAGEIPQISRTPLSIVDDSPPTHGFLAQRAPDLAEGDLRLGGTNRRVLVVGKYPARICSITVDSCWSGSASDTKFLTGSRASGRYESATALSASDIATKLPESTTDWTTFSTS